MSKIYVTKSYMPPMDEYFREIAPLWDSHILTNMGLKHEELREKLKSYLGVENIELFTNGHMSLELSLQCFDFPIGSEVITTPFTFASTTHAIVRNGLKPIFCDIKTDDFTIDESKIEALISPRTVAIMPVHVYGNPCNTELIDKIAAEHGLRVIYDSAHAFGEDYKGRGIGSYGDISCFSFHATKVFNTIEGGAAAFNDKGIGESLYGLKNFGIENATTVSAVGSNAKMNEFAAAFGLCNLRHIDEEIIKRKNVYETYHRALKGVKGIRLNDCGLSHLDRANYAYFPIIVEDEYGIDRDRLCEKLSSADIIPRKYFYPLTTEFDCYKGKFNSSSTPIALSLSKRVLTLPMYGDLTHEDIERVSNIIRENGH